MIDDVESELGRYLERLLARMPVGARRKKQIRAELLGHLLALYDEERPRWATAQETIEAAQRRFGDPECLAEEFRRSVPWLEGWVERLLNGKERSMWRWLLVLGLLAVLIGLGFVMPALSHLRDAGHLLGYQILLLLLGLSLTLAGIGSTIYGSVQAYRARTC